MHDAPAVARLLVEISQRQRLAGESPYRARAYARAAESLLTLIVPLEDVIAQGRLREIPGVGAALAEVIRTLHRPGTTSGLEAMRADVPAGVLELLKPRSAGPAPGPTARTRSIPSQCRLKPASARSRRSPRGRCAPPSPLRQNPAADRASPRRCAPNAAADRRGAKHRRPGGQPPFGPPEVAAMSRTVSPSSSRPYGLARVCRVWRASAPRSIAIFPPLGPNRRGVRARVGRCRMPRWSRRSAPS